MWKRPVFKRKTSVEPPYYYEYTVHMGSSFFNSLKMTGSSHFKSQVLNRISKIVRDLVLGNYFSRAGDFWAF